LERSVFGVGAARLEVGFVLVERAVDRERRAVGRAVLLPARLPAPGLARLMDVQQRRAVRWIVVVGLADGLSPEPALAVGGLQHPCTIPGGVAPVQQPDATPELQHDVRLARRPGLQFEPCCRGIEFAMLPRHDFRPRFRPKECPRRSADACAAYRSILSGDQ
jgi:hypothetical protein